MLFRNLFGIGDVTLRLETGLGTLAWLNKKAPNLDDIFARDITCVNGHGGVALTPHTISHGVVAIKGVRTFSCAHAVSIGHGYVSPTRNNESDPKLGLTPGDFDPTCIVEDVVAIFGHNAQLKTQYFVHLPDELYVERKNGVGIIPDYGNAKPSKVHIGPSVCAVKYGSVSVLDSSDDDPIDLREETVRAYGFTDQLPRYGIIRAGEFEFKHKTLDFK